jgi:hypothetical protein
MKMENPVDLNEFERQETTYKIKDTPAHILNIL